MLGVCPQGTRGQGLPCARVWSSPPVLVHAGRELSNGQGIARPWIGIGIARGITAFKSMLVGDKLAEPSTRLAAAALAVALLWGCQRTTCASAEHVSSHQQRMPAMLVSATTPIRRAHLVVCAAFADFGGASAVSYTFFRARFRKEPDGKCAAPASSGGPPGASECCCELLTVPLGLPAPRAFPTTATCGERQR
eukprot:scaffold644_cov353-Prasinococcus_capsulatus_cf.AAC.3